MSLRRLGKCASDGLRPRAAKLSRQIRPCSNSRVPLRIVSRFQPRSRSARRCPPDPSSLTVRAMNNRRALPFSALAVSMNKALNESVNSIVGSPALLSLECMIHHLGWFNFCVSLTKREDVVEDLQQIQKISAAQAEYLQRAIKRIATRYQQRTKTDANMYERLFAQFKIDMGIPRYDALPAKAYAKALAWLQRKADEYLPNDPDALPPLQEQLL